MATVLHCTICKHLKYGKSFPKAGPVLAVQAAHSTVTTGRADAIQCRPLQDTVSLAQRPPCPLALVPKENSKWSAFFIFVIHQLAHQRRAISRNALILAESSSGGGKDSYPPHPLTAYGMLARHPVYRPRVRMLCAIQDSGLEPWPLTVPIKAVQVGFGSSKWQKSTTDSLACTATSARLLIWIDSGSFLYTLSATIRASSDPP